MIQVFSQQDSTRLWVQLADKDNSPFSITNPEAFLSNKAIERRTKQNIAIDESDLPLNPSYIDSLEFFGVKVLNKSRWFNAVSIKVDTGFDLSQIEDLPFVATIEEVISISGKREIEKFETINNELLPKVNVADYGFMYNQIKMLNGDLLHLLGFKGDSMHIAIMDAGFRKVDELLPFTHLWNENRILGTYDFVDNKEDVFDASFHGMHVLSTMAAVDSSSAIGTAPNAQYYLFKTEDVGSEFRIEEDNWIAAAELADSLGVDVINTSLGYSEFSDPTMDYSYADMDGNTARISIAATQAASKGILVVNSAGNEGLSSWRHITAPADGRDVLAVGAVNEDGIIASFSSRGPSADGRIKPNVSAQGQNVIVLSSFGVPATSNGTSFSSPIIAGLATCLWQAFPNNTNLEIVKAIELSAHLAENPNNDYGYGIPNFYNAYLFLKAYNENLFDLSHTNSDPNSEDIFSKAEDKFLVYPNPFQSDFNVLLYSEREDIYTLQLFNTLGEILYHENFYMRARTFFKLKLDTLQDIPVGEYILRLQSSDGKTNNKLLKID